MPPTFGQLWQGYPVENQADFFASLGGGWPAEIGKPAFANTCALRISVAMMRAGVPVPQDLASADGNLKTGSGAPLIVRVTTAKLWLERLLGPSSWGTSKAVGADIDDLVPAWTGILLYRLLVPTDASGHVDLWDGHGCRVDCHNTFARAATTVELWQLP